jgi:hypothetical protein
METVSTTERLAIASTPVRAAKAALMISIGRWPQNERACRPQSVFRQPSRLRSISARPVRNARKASTGQGLKVLTG